MNCTWGAPNRHDRRVPRDIRGVRPRRPSIKRRLSEQVEQIKQVTCLVEVVCAEPGVAR